MYEGVGIHKLASQILEKLDNARPYELMSVDVAVPKDQLQAVLEKRFRLWEQTWIRPLAEAIKQKSKRR